MQVPLWWDSWPPFQPHPSFPVPWDQAIQNHQVHEHFPKRATWFHSSLPLLLSGIFPCPSQCSTFSWRTLHSSDIPQGSPLWEALGDPLNRSRSFLVLWSHCTWYMLSHCAFHTQGWWFVSCTLSLTVKVPRTGSVAYFCIKGTSQSAQHGVKT